MAKLEKLVFYLFVFCLPFQTRIILKSWGSGFNEWNSAFLYGTDILLAMFFLLWAVRAITDQRRSGYTQLFPEFRQDPSQRNFRKSWVCTPKASRDYFLFIFLILCGLSLAVADNLALGFYRLVKILEFIGLYYYIRSSLGKIFTLTNSFLVVAISGFFQAIIAIGQSLLQHSLGLKWLGESILRTNFNAVAIVPVEGEKFLRAYGTLPHPNLLAAWLFLGIFAFYFWYLYHGEKKPLSRGEDQTNQQYTHSKIPERVVEGQEWVGIADLSRALHDPFVFSIYSVLLWGFLATFSRVAIGLWVAGILARLLLIFIKKKKYNLDLVFKKRLRLLFITTVAVVGAFCLVYWPQVHSRILISSQEQAVSQRILYTKVAGDIVSDHPWLGVGLGQFVGNLQSSFKNYPAYFYQPVHNIYLLILDEVGIFGLAVFFAWLIVLILQYRQQTRFKELYHASFFIVFVSVLIMGFFDHFLWTLQQGQLIFWLTIGLIRHFLQKVPD